MCGIVGFAQKEPFLNEEINTINFLLPTISHRGPDQNGIFTDNHVQLGHTRLSILDLSEKGIQPMHTLSERCVIVFNGEVYNFEEIKNKFQIQTFSTSDTGVIVELYEKIGLDFVQHLNGMFAIAIYDKFLRKLILCRDRLGVKPLFYSFDRSKQRLLFGSEIKSLLPICNKQEINQEALQLFLHNAYIPAPHTIYDGIKKFPSGNIGIFDLNTCDFSIKPYWNIKDKILQTPNNSETEALEELDKLLESSIKYRLISDVECGVFLSGGIDSSLVTAYSSENFNGKIKSFTIGFHSKKNEANYAKKIANYLKTDHYEHYISTQDILDLVPDLMATYDEPYGDFSAIPSMLVSQFARQKVKVALSGDGGDELFHGYGFYNWADRLENPIFKARKVISKIASQIPSRLGNRIASLYDFNPKETLQKHIFSADQNLFSISEIEKISKKEWYSGANQIDNKFFKRKLSLKELLALDNIENYLQEDILTKMDRASMKFGLEVREPLLDYRIVEFAVNLNSRLKTKQDSSKYLLKELLYKKIPSSFFDRPKWGFGMPQDQLFKNELRPLLHQYLESESSPLFDLFDKKEINKLLNRFLNSENYLYSRIWLLVVIGLWIDHSKKAKNGY